MSHPTEQDLDNALQKTAAGLRKTIRDNPNNVSILREVYCGLFTSTPVWIACAYHYKGRELCNFAIDCLLEQKESLARQAKKQRAEIDKLQAHYDALAGVLWKAEQDWKNAA